MEKLYIAFPSANKNTVLNIVVFMPHDKENLRGMIQICHGMTEHIDRYDDFAEYFTERGYAVFGNDIISHGRSNVNKSWSLYLDDWFDTVRDAINVRNHITKIYPDLPVYIVGFSLGSFIVRSMPDLSAYNKEILVGTGYQPAAMLHVMKGLIAVKFNKQMRYVKWRLTAIINISRATRTIIGYCQMTLQETNTKQTGLYIHA